MVSSGVGTFTVCYGARGLLRMQGGETLVLAGGECE